MDFDDSPEEAEYRATVRAWLEENAKEYKNPPPEGLTDADNIARSKDWQAKKAAGGYAAINQQIENINYSEAK